MAATAMVGAGLLGFATSASAATSTIYVSPNGIDIPQCGTQQVQCKTIQYGIGQASPGDTVQVAAGSYNEAVSITFPLTLQGAGASSTTIDGSGTTAGDSQNGGLVSIVDPGGNVTVDGFTVENAPASASGQAFDITSNDTNADDTTTISNNDLDGYTDDADAAADGPAGYYSLDSAADQVITGNTVSGVWQGIFSEGATGATTVSDNTLTGLVPYVIGNDSYPAEGVYINQDSGNTSSNQDVTDNTFENYGGTGIKYTAGYQDANCTSNVCDGSISGSVTGNTFDLAAADSSTDPDFTASALFLQAVYAGNDLDLTVGGNTGTVDAPTVPITEKPNAGAITLTPGTAANSIVPTPAPTASVTGLPTKIITDEAPQSFSAAVTNGSGESLPNTRYDVAITGKSGLAATSVDLEYQAAGSSTYTKVKLTGVANKNGIVGSFDPSGTNTLSTGTTTTPLEISIPKAVVSQGAITLTLSVDQFDNGKGSSSAAINSIASASGTTNVVNNAKPSAPNISASTKLNTPVTITLGSSTDSDGDTVTYTTGKPSHGTVSAPTTSNGSVTVTYTPTTGYTGSDAFGYTASDGKAGSNSGAVSITVAKVGASVSATTNPSPLKQSKSKGAKVIVTFTPQSGGSVDGSKATLSNGSNVFGTMTVSGGKATFTLNNTQTVETHYFTLTYAGSSTVAAFTTKVKVTVVKG